VSANSAWFSNEFSDRRRKIPPSVSISDYISCRQVERAKSRVIGPRRLVTTQDDSKTTKDLGTTQGESRLAKGTVKWFSEQKGYGFITPDEGGKDLFVHFSSIIGEGFRNLEDGQQVEFEAAEGQKGPEAQSVRLV